MIYEIIRQNDDKTWIIENPAFVRYSNDEVYCLTNEANAHAVYIEGTCYHIMGRAPIQGLEEVTVGISSETVYSNVEVKQKLDAQTIMNAELNTVIDDIIIAITPTEAN